MGRDRVKLVAISLGLLTVAGTAMAQNPAPSAPAATAPAGTPAATAAPARPPALNLSDLLMSAGISVSGYVDATGSYFSYSGSHLLTSATGTSAPAPAARDYDTFDFQQAGLTIAMQPSAGFGGLLNVVATPYSSVYVDNYAPDTHYYLSSGSAPGSPTFAILQGYAQWAGGPWTVIAGKFTTLAGAEVYSPTGNTNVTRSLLYTFEPVTHTGVRATFAPSGTLSFDIGVNNGWFNNGDENSAAAAKTIEAAFSVTPNKRVTWLVANYYGRDKNYYGTTSGLELLDTVVTVAATPTLTLIGSVDYDDLGGTSTSPAANWWGAAGYLNYQFNTRWRLSLRGEYFDDENGYLTELAYVGSAPYSPLLRTGSERLAEATLTFGYDPGKHLEFRIEGRYDDPSRVSPSGTAADVPVYSRTIQSWLEALYHF